MDLGDLRSAEFARRCERVFALLADLAEDLPISPAYRRVLALALDEGFAQAETNPGIPCVQLPWLSARALGASDDQAARIAAVCTLVYLGADVLDNVADDELPVAWADHGPAIATLAGATFLSCLVTRGVSELETVGLDPADCWHLVRELSTGMLEMSSGQHRDVVGATKSVDDSLAIADAKAGGEFALFARAGAMVATRHVAPISNLSEMGRAYGIALQLLSDAHDLFSGDANDIANGKITFPVAHALVILETPQAMRLQALLDGGRPLEAREEILDLLREAGSLRYTLFVGEVYRQRALRFFRAALPSSESRGELAALVEGVSLLRKVPEPIS
jgi:geranylgeranyl pyrophosphate synthase